jgi:hypothetical protein
MNGNCNPNVNENHVIDAGWISGIPLEAGSPEIKYTPDPTTGVIGL